MKPQPGLTLLMLFLVLPLSNAAELKPETLQAWGAYVCAAELRMKERASGQAPFLWVDEDRDLATRLRAGEVLAETVDGLSLHTVPRGLIHDWIGAVFVPKARLVDVMGVLGDYDRYKDFFGPMVVKARLLEQKPEHEVITLLMMQKALSVTGAVQIENEIHTTRVDADRVYSLSASVRVQEIADYGTPASTCFRRITGQATSGGRST